MIRKLGKWGSLFIISFISFTLFLHLTLPGRNGQKGTGDIAIQMYKSIYVMRNLKRLKHDSDFYKAKANEALPFFKLPDLPFTPGIEEEVEYKREYQRRRPTTNPPRHREEIAMGSLYFLIDDGRYDAQQILRCAKNDYYKLNKTDCAEKERYDVKPYNLTIWTTDYSSGAVEDIKFLLEPMGIKVIAKMFSPNCFMYKNCAKGVAGLSSMQGLLLKDSRKELFQKTALQNPEFASADAVLCIRPAAMCELYEPFNKSIFINIDTRYEFGRWAPERWNNWNSVLARISKNKNNMVTATSQYDIEYMRYYTNNAPALLKPYCGYIKDSYSPTTSNHFLLTPLKSYTGGLEKTFLSNVKVYAGMQNSSILLSAMGNTGFDQSSSNIVKYAGIVLVPYQVSSLRMTEYYRMNIPLFVPSLELLTNWQLKHKIISKMSWGFIAKHFRASPIEEMPGKLSIPNPNDMSSKDAIGFWLNFAEFYSMPHVIIYSSVQNLVTKLTAYSKPRKLVLISERMKQINKKEKENIKMQWRTILDKIQQRKKDMNFFS